MSRYDIALGKPPAQSISNVPCDYHWHFLSPCDRISRCSKCGESEPIEAYPKEPSSSPGLIHGPVVPPMQTINCSFEIRDEGEVTKFFDTWQRIIGGVERSTIPFVYHEEEGL